MEHEFRRLLPRLIVDWQGVVKLDGPTEEPWRDCRVVDISSAGAGLELANTSAEVVEGASLLLAIHLRSQVKHRRQTVGGRLMVGTEFTHLTDGECAYLASLHELQAHW
jgi:hypothetical protein